MTPIFPRKSGAFCERKNILCRVVSQTGVIPVLTQMTQLLCCYISAMIPLKFGNINDDITFSTT